MTDVENDLRRLFGARAGAAVPVDALEDVLAGTTRLVATATRVRDRHAILLAAAVILLLGAGGIVMLRRAGPPAQRPAPAVDFPADRPVAPLLDADRAARVAGSLLVVSGPDGPRPVSGDSASSWASWNACGQAVTDVEGAAPAASYVAACCAPGSTIWHDGVVIGEGVRLDYEVDGVVRAVVDPARDSVTIGELTLHEPDVVDVAMVDRSTALLLIRGHTPTVVRLTADEWRRDAEVQREALSLPTLPAACAVVTLDGAALVLAGDPDEAGRCISDRAVVVDLPTLTMSRGVRLPALTVNVNSDHHRQVVAVSTSGDLLLGTVRPSSPDVALDWVTIALGADFSAVDFLR